MHDESLIADASAELSMDRPITLTFKAAVYFTLLAIASTIVGFGTNFFAFKDAAKAECGMVFA